MDNPSDIDELKQLRKKISNLMAEIAGRDEAIEAMERRIRAEESQHKGCKGALTKALAELADNDELFETMDKAMNRLCDDNVKLSDDYDDLEKRFTSSAAYAEELELGTEELDSQIEDLKKYKERAAEIFVKKDRRILAIWEEHGYKITTDQIDRAWLAARGSESSLSILRLLGITACGECGGSGVYSAWDFHPDEKPHRGQTCSACEVCGGNGWIVK